MRLHKKSIWPRTELIDITNLLVEMSEPTDNIRSEKNNIGFRNPVRVCRCHLFCFQANFLTSSEWSSSSTVTLRVSFLLITTLCLSHNWSFSFCGYFVSVCNSPDCQFAQNGEETRAKMSKVFIHYAHKMGVQLDSLRFLLDGERIDGEITPQTLEMVRVTNSIFLAQNWQHAYRLVLVLRFDKCHWNRKMTTKWMSC